MTITKTAWESYIKRMSAIDTRAAESMLDYVAKHGIEDRKRLIDYAYAIATKYGEASAALAAEMYDAVAELSGLRLPDADVADTADYSEVAKSVNGSLKRSLNDELLAQAISMLVKRCGQDTTLKNAIRDGAEFAWIPHGDTCAYCLALASNGWRKAGKKTLAGDHAEHIHAHCDCAYAIRFNSKTDYEGFDPDEYLEAYKSAGGDSPKEKINSMRRQMYQENKDKINEQKRAAYAARKERDKG